MAATNLGLTFVFESTLALERCRCIDSELIRLCFIMPSPLRGSACMHFIRSSSAESVDSYRLFACAGSPAVWLSSLTVSSEAECELLLAQLTTLGILILNPLEQRTTQA
jgi:hypothetical protein